MFPIVIHLAQPQNRECYRILEPGETDHWTRPPRLLKAGVLRIVTHSHAVVCSLFYRGRERRWPKNSQDWAKVTSGKSCDFRGHAGSSASLVDLRCDPVSSRHESRAFPVCAFLCVSILCGLRPVLTNFVILSIYSVNFIFTVTLQTVSECGPAPRGGCPRKPSLW